MHSRKMRMGSTDRSDVDESPTRPSNLVGEGGKSRRNLIMRLASELTPVEPIVKTSPPRSPGGSMSMGPSVPIHQTPSGKLRQVKIEPPIFETLEEVAEMMDMSEEEAEEVLVTNPRHVRRWLNPLDLGVSLSETPATSAIVEDSSTEADVGVISEVKPRPSTSGVTSMSMTAPRPLVDYGSDFDSEYDDEFDGTITGIVSSERGIPNEEELDEPARDIINNIEQGMDHALVDLLSNQKDFQWTAGYESFRSVPEEFSGPAPGPIRDYDSPYSAFIDIWDESIIDRIVLETNRYAKQTIESLVAKGELKPTSRLRQWTDTDRDEILLLFGVYMLMAIDARTSLHEYWKGGLLGMPEFRSIISYNRHILLNKFLHFVPNDGTGSVEPGMSIKLQKLAPIIQHLQQKFSTLYNMGRDISLDESLTLFKGRLSWVQAIRSKAARFGIKSYELCESSTGYMSRFQIYTGKSDIYSNTDMSVGADLGGKTIKVVLELLQGLDHRGHCVTMDNFYNSPALARYLKSQGFDCLGTLRVSRWNVPNDIAKVPNNVAKGTIVARHSGDVSIVAWKDTKVVTIISTFHDAETFVGSKAGKAIVKPVCVGDYNKTMGGVDLKDQKLSMYLMERKRGMKWYIKMFKRLMNVSIHNAFVMYVRSLRRRGMPPITHREFRYQLAQSLIDKYRPRPKEIVMPAAEMNTRLRKDILHTPKIMKGAKARRRCQVCYKCRNIEKKVNTYCSTCDAFLCFEGDCWVKWHSPTKALETKETRGRKRKHYE